MLKFVILLTAVACNLGAYLPGASVPQLDGRIVGGTVASSGQFPYQASLRYNGRHICGASIINEKTLLTAAHCTINGDVKNFAVRVGSTVSNQGGLVIPVANIINHAQYNSWTMENDIAIICLSSDLPFSSSIKAVPYATTAPTNDAAAVVSGWGTTSYGGSSSTDLLYAEVHVLTDEYCKHYYPNAIKNGMVCTSINGKDACQGDSGGPLVCDGILIGIVSWGYGCASPYYPGVYTEVANFASWIAQYSSYCN